MIRTPHGLIFRLPSGAAFLVLTEPGPCKRCKAQHYFFVNRGGETLCATCDGGEPELRAGDSVWVVLPDGTRLPVPHAYGPHLVANHPGCTFEFIRRTHVMVGGLLPDGSKARPLATDAEARAQATRTAEERSREVHKLAGQPPPKGRPARSPRVSECCGAPITKAPPPFESLICTKCVNMTRVRQK